jgi:hypothetical protein
MFLLCSVTRYKRCKRKRQPQANTDQRQLSSLLTDFQPLSHFRICQSRSICNFQENQISTNAKVKSDRNNNALKSAGNVPTSANVSRDPASTSLGNVSTSANISHDPASTSLGNVPTSANISHDPASTSAGNVSTPVSDSHDPN